MDRIDIIKESLKALSPSYLEIIDESPSHAGHFDSTHSRTHLKIIIASPYFEKGKILKNHRKVKELLSEEFNKGLHALTIEIKGY